MAFVLGIGDRLEKLPIAPGTADVFGRAAAARLDQPRIGDARLGVAEARDLDGVLPAVAEVVDVPQCLCADILDHIAEARLAGVERAVRPARVGNPPSDIAGADYAKPRRSPSWERSITPPAGSSCTPAKPSAAPTSLHSWRRSTVVWAKAGCPDQACRHRARQRADPQSKASRAALAARAHWLTVRWLPKYAPELNDIEVVWHDLKAHHLVHHTFIDAEALDRAIHAAVTSLNTERNVHPLAKQRIFCLGHPPY